MSSQSNGTSSFDLDSLLNIDDAMLADLGSFMDAEQQKQQTTARPATAAAAVPQAATTASNSHLDALLDIDLGDQDIDMLLSSIGAPTSGAASQQQQQLASAQPASASAAVAAPASVQVRAVQPVKPPVTTVKQQLPTINTQQAKSQQPQQKAPTPTAAASAQRPVSPFAAVPGFPFGMPAGAAGALNPQLFAAMTAAAAAQQRPPGAPVAAPQLPFNPAALANMQPQLAAQIIAQTNPALANVLLNNPLAQQFLQQQMQMQQQMKMAQATPTPAAQPKPVQPVQPQPQQIQQPRSATPQFKTDNNKDALVDTTVEFDPINKWPKCVGRIKQKMYVHEKFKPAFAEALDAVRSNSNDGSTKFKAYIIPSKPQNIFVFCQSPTELKAVGTISITDQADAHIYHLLRHGIAQCILDIENMWDLQPLQDEDNFYVVYFNTFITKKAFEIDERIYKQTFERLLQGATAASEDDDDDEAFMRNLPQADRQHLVIKKSYLLLLLNAVEKKNKPVTRAFCAPQFAGSSMAQQASSDGERKPKRAKLEAASADEDLAAKDPEDGDEEDDLSDLDEDDELNEYIVADSGKEAGAATAQPGAANPAAPKDNGILPEDSELDQDLARTLGNLTTVVSEDEEAAAADTETFDDDEDEAAPNPATLIDTPKGLASELRSYQKVALAWMLNRERAGEDEEDRPRKLHPLFSKRRFLDGTIFYFNPTYGLLSRNFIQGPPEPKGGILADQMGLGKTVEVISLIVANQSELTRQSGSKPRFTKNGMLKTRATLVVTPLTIVDQWKHEIERHTSPSLKVHVYQGTKRIRQADKLAHFDVIVTTYNTLQIEYSTMVSAATNAQLTNNATPGTAAAVPDNCPMYKMSFHRIVLDEAHNIKNRKSQQAKSVTAVDAEHRWAVTGTPIQNHVDDLFSLFHFLKVVPHGDWRWWSKYVSKPFEKKELRVQALATLESLIKDMIIRRTKNKKINGESILDLPTKHIHLVKLKFTRAEEEFYKLFHAFSKREVENIVKTDTVGKNYANILQMLLYLRQICCHPGLVLVSYMKKRDNQAIRQCLGDFCKQQPQDVRDCMFPLMPKVLDKMDSGDIDLPAYLRQSWKGSSKINALIKYLNQIKHTTKSVIFSQWTSMLDMVQIATEKNDIRCVRLDGSMSRKDRDEAVQTFKNDPGISCCLISLKVGGIGLNLVWATHVFLMDPWWNPAIEEQAIDRVHRIGQNKEVTVIRFVVKDTVEERILELQQRKQEIADDALESSSSGAFTLGKGDAKLRIDDLKRLFDIDQQRHSSNGADDDDPDAMLDDLGDDEDIDNLLDDTYM